MNKKGYIIYSILQILIFVEIYLAKYFSVRKMGVMRHLAYMNQKLHPFIAQNAKNIFLVMTVVLLLSIFREKIKSKLRLESIAILFFSLIYVGIIRKPSEVSYNVTTFSFIVLNIITTMKYFALV